MCLYINQVLVVKTLSVYLCYCLFVLNIDQCNAMQRGTHKEKFTLWQCSNSYMLYFTKANLLSFTKLQLVKVDIYVM
jgi:hypothetical protein